MRALSRLESTQRARGPRLDADILKTPALAWQMSQETLGHPTDDTDAIDRVFNLAVVQSSEASHSGKLSA